MSAVDPLLLIGGASLPAGRDCLDQANARGIPVWLADTSANLARLPQLTQRAVRVVELPYYAPDSCVSWARLQRGKQEFLGVYGFREQAVQSVAAMSEVLGTAGIGLATARKLQDKAACRQALRECGFRQPPSARCRDRAEALRFMAAHKPGPWVLKPPAAQGSIGISLLNDPGDLDPALTHLASSCADFAHDTGASQDHRTVSTDPAATFLMEGFQTGVEYSAEGVCLDGRPRVLVVTEKSTTGPPHFVEIGHAMPADLGQVRQEAVEGTVCAALTALGLTWGVFHVELWIDGHEVVLGEMHARPGGDHIHTMTQHVTDLELHGTVLDQFLGRVPAARPARPLPGAAIRFLTPAPGRITRVTGWNEVLADPRVLTGHCDLAIGQVIRPLTSYLDRTSYVVATGPTRQSAADSAIELCTTVRVETAACSSPDTRPVPDKNRQVS
ncbi:MAG: ATP-grasp domain-containing protein [Pseudonocardiaceae bacterium]